jgi:DNA-binding transcriptional ArsR family regulator
MAITEDIVAEVWERLARHFRESSDRLTPGQVSEMTGFSPDSIEHALTVLFNNGMITGYSGG